jgi:mannose-6-phosphate isomerase
MLSIALLKNPVLPYAWGSRTFIHGLLGKPSPGKRPLAEMWMGVHPNGPSLVSWKGRWMPLAEFIGEDPAKALGRSVARGFSNKLPFLFKVLAAEKPLSIQVHPDRGQALDGFRREEDRGVSPGAPERNYKDPNHKPEIFCALSPVWALKGFRRTDQCLALTDKLRASRLFSPLRALLSEPMTDGMKPFFSALSVLNRENPGRAVQEALHLLEDGPSDDPALMWVAKLSRAFPDDIMALSPLFLNLVRLEPGDAIHISPGTLHAYLEGAGVELMADSDNVLRAGLTAKHTDLIELLKIVRFSHEPVNILRPEKKRGWAWAYPSESREFSLSMIALRKGSSYASPKRRSLEILISVKGRAKITDLGTGQSLALNRGVSVVVPAIVDQYSIKGTGEIYKASVPLGRS